MPALLHFFCATTRHANETIDPDTIGPDFYAPISTIFAWSAMEKGAERNYYDLKGFKTSKQVYSPNRGFANAEKKRDRRFYDLKTE